MDFVSLYICNIVFIFNAAWWLIMECELTTEMHNYVQNIYYRLIRRALCAKIPASWFTGGLLRKSVKATAIERPPSINMETELPNHFRSAHMTLSFLCVSNPIIAKFALGTTTVVASYVLINCHAAIITSESHKRGANLTSDPLRKLFRKYIPYSNPERGAQ